MSFRKNENQQLTLTDSFLNLSPRNKKIVESSWCKDFAEIVFPAIQEERFSVLYSDKNASRPNAPVNFIIGALMLKELQGLSDNELMEAICCDVRYQYALHSTSLVDQPVSDRTFSRFRERLYNYSLETGIDLLKEEFLNLNEVYMKFMNLQRNVKRMDSLMVASRCKKMSRLEIIYSAASNAVKLMKRLGEEELIPANLLHYLDEEDYNQTIYYCKGDNVSDRLRTTLQEAEQILEIMKDDIWMEHTEYELLLRVVTEQARWENGKITPLKNEEIESGSLQNPSDPDATFRRKAGENHTGYVMNVIETIGKESSLITGIDIQPNTYSDSQFCKDYITEKKDAEPETMIADGAYGGTTNQELSAEKGIELVTTSLSGKDPDVFLAGFQFNDTGDKVITCPMGHEPIKTTYYPRTGMCRVLFSQKCCSECPYREICKAKEQKKNYAVHISSKMVQRAKYLQKLSTEDYKKLTRQRNAVEGIPSVLRRKYHIDSLPVFGLIRVKLFACFMAMAYNFKKVCSFNNKRRGKCALQAGAA